MKYLVPLILSIFFYNSGITQDMKFGLGLGSNISLVQTSSELSIQNQSNYKPAFGGEIGLATAIELSDNLMFLGGFQFLNLRTKSTEGVLFFDPSGVYTNQNYREKRQSINSLLIELNLAYRLSPLFYLGTGANVSILINANTKYILSGTEFKVPTSYLDPMRFYIPFFLGINKDNYMVSLGYRQGIGGRLRDNNSLITESEGHFFIDLKVFFNQNK